MTAHSNYCRWGPLGYLAYGGVYALLELAIIPAIPLTMTAGVLFGVLPGLAVVSASGTLAATLSFLIARYAARDKVRTPTWVSPFASSGCCVMPPRQRSLDDLASWACMPPVAATCTLLSYLPAVVQRSRSCNPH